MVSQLTIEKEKLIMDIVTRLAYEGLLSDQVITGQMAWDLLSEVLILRNDKDRLETEVSKLNDSLIVYKSLFDT